MYDRPQVREEVMLPDIAVVEECSGSGATTAVAAVVPVHCTSRNLSNGVKATWKSVKSKPCRVITAIEALSPSNNLRWKRGRRLVR